MLLTRRGRPLSRKASKRSTNGSIWRRQIQTYSRRKHETSTSRFRLVFHHRHRWKSRCCSQYLTSIITRCWYTLRQTLHDFKSSLRQNILCWRNGCSRSRPETWILRTARMLRCLRFTSTAYRCSVACTACCVSCQPGSSARDYVDGLGTMVSVSNYGSME